MIQPLHRGAYKPAHLNYRAWPDPAPTCERGPSDREIVERLRRTLNAQGYECDADTKQQQDVLAWMRGRAMSAGELVVCLLCAGFIGFLLATGGVL